MGKYRTTIGAQANRRLPHALPSLAPEHRHAEHPAKTDCWFVGFVDDDGTFDTAEMSSTYVDGTAFQFTIDDVITAPAVAPAPPAIALLILGLTGLVGLRHLSRPAA